MYNDVICSNVGTGCLFISETFTSIFLALNWQNVITNHILHHKVIFLQNYVEDFCN